MFTLGIIFGGVALILFGVRFLRKGLDRLFGARMALWLQDLGQRPVRSFFAGIALAALTPSSSTISALAVNAIKSGHLTARQTLVILHGTDIGLTILVVLLSFRIDSYAPILILVGVLLFQFTRSDLKRGVGQILLSLAFILLGVGISKSAVSAVADNPDVVQLMTIAQHYPLALVLAAESFTMAFQSSTAALGLVIAVGHIESTSLDLIIPAVLGANLGISVTTLILGWEQVEARRLGVAKLIGKVVTAALCMACMKHVSAALTWLPGTLDWKVAATHIGFNVLNAGLSMPFDRWYYRAAQHLAPEPPRTQHNQFAPRHLAGVHAELPALALGLSRKEIMHVGEITRRMLADIWTSLKTNDADLARAVAQTDDQIDQLDTQIKHYLTRTVSVDADPEDSAEQLRQLRYLNELENIGDIIDKNLSELAVKKAKLKLDFTREDWSDLDAVFTAVSQCLVIADTAFTTRDKALARSLLERDASIHKLDEELRGRHFDRLKRGNSEHFQTSAIHLDVLTNLKRINSHVCHVAVDVAR